MKSNLFYFVIFLLALQQCVCDNKKDYILHDFDGYVFFLIIHYIRQKKMYSIMYVLKVNLWTNLHTYLVQI